MALVEKVRVIAQDKSGTVITVRNTTGLESDGVTTGYGPTNGETTDVLEYILEFSRIASSEIARVRITPASTYPVLADVLNGQDFNVNTSLFEEDHEFNNAIFYDGVINVDSYSAWAGLSGVSIVKGSDFISGADFTDTLLGDAIQVDGNIYLIDKDLSTTSTLYIHGTFIEDGSSFDILYKGNTKALMQAVTDNQHAYIVAKLAKECNLGQSAFTGKLNEALHYKIAANGFVKHCSDWYKANDLVIGAGKILNKILMTC